MTEYFQSQARNHTQSQESFMVHKNTVGHPILGPIQDLQTDPLFPSIASHVNTRVFLIKSPSPSSSTPGSGSAMVPYNNYNGGNGLFESFESSSSSVGAGMGLSTFFQNSYTSTPGTMWGATSDLQGNGRIVLQEPPKQMLHDPKLTSLISTMIMRYPHRKNDLLEVSRRYHNEVLGNIQS
jgi:hypothetical protein